MPLYAILKTSTPSLSWLTLQLDFKQTSETMSESYLSHLPENASEAHKHYEHEDGLDQEIQRAIAQHDLAQQLQQTAVKEEPHEEQVTMTGEIQVGGHQDEPEQVQEQEQQVPEQHEQAQEREQTQEPQEISVSAGLELPEVSAENIPTVPEVQQEPQPMVPAQPQPQQEKEHQAQQEKQQEHQEQQTQQQAQQLIDGLVEHQVEQQVEQQIQHVQQQVQQQVAEEQQHQQNQQSQTESSETNVFAQTSSKASDVDVEKLSLQMIADELKRATTDQNIQDLIMEDAKNTEKPNLPGYIPPDSELLATNTALAAYNALSSHVPPVALLANVQLAAVPLPIVAADYLPARIQLLINTLAVLDNLASQLLRIFAMGPYQKIIDLASSPETPSGAAFRDLTSLFEFTKRLYSEEDPFLTVEHLAPGMWKEGEKTPSMFRSREQTIESTLRKVNLATFLAATLGTIEVGFFYLNESFLDVFCPYNTLDPANSMSNMNATNMSLQSGVNTVIGDKVGKLLKSQAVLYLGLKTQAYISAIEAGERSREEILEDILPSNLEQLLLERRGVKTLYPSELDFVARCKSRKETLLNYPEGSNLSEEYEWFEFLKEMFDYVSKNMGFLIWGKRGKPSGRSERSTGISADNNSVPSATPHSEDALRESTLASVNTDHVDAAASQEINDITSALLPSEIQEQQIHIRINPRMQGKVTNRRPWTREEEKALRHALELKGPLWSTILELFGQGGRINESLKNRTQVQLKDKARNWKMFFLKSGLPVPSYLLKVTGDLERDDKLRAKNARNRKTAAAPVPSVPKKDNEVNDAQFDTDSPEATRKRRKVT